MTVAVGYRHGLCKCLVTSRIVTWLFLDNALSQSPCSELVACTWRERGVLMPHVRRSTRGGNRRAGRPAATVGSCCCCYACCPGAAKHYKIQAKLNSWRSSKWIRTLLPRAPLSPCRVTIMAPSLLRVAVPPGRWLVPPAWIRGHAGSSAAVVVPSWAPLRLPVPSGEPPALCFPSRLWASAEFHSRVNQAARPLRARRRQ